MPYRPIVQCWLLIPICFPFSKFIGGPYVRTFSVAAPTYLSEVASMEKRGAMVARHQFLIFFASESFTQVELIVEKGEVKMTALNEIW